MKVTGLDINAADGAGKTALIQSAEKGGIYFELVRLTPDISLYIHWLFAGFQDIMMELLKYQELQIGAEDSEGRNALLHALRGGRAIV